MSGLSWAPHMKWVGGKSRIPGGAFGLRVPGETHRLLRSRRCRRRPPTGSAPRDLVDRDRERPPALLAVQRGHLGGVAVDDQPRDAPRARRASGDARGRRARRSRGRTGTAGGSPASRPRSGAAGSSGPPWIHSRCARSRAHVSSGSLPRSASIAASACVHAAARRGRSPTPRPRRRAGRPRPGRGRSGRSWRPGRSRRPPSRAADPRGRAGHPRPPRRPGAPAGSVVARATRSNSGQVGSLIQV